VQTSGGLPYRRTIRLGRTEQCEGVYFVTICTAGRKHIFGEVIDGLVNLSPAGLIAQEEWLRTSTVRPDVILDEFIFMPNHMHALVYVPPSPPGYRAHCRAPLHRPPRSLASLVAQYKAAVTRRLKRPVWQRNYFEHAVRDGRELDIYRKYIRDNPLRWAFDRENITPPPPAHQTSPATSP
jgi:putative transposase